MVEIMIAMMVFALSAAGLVSALTQTSKFNRFNQEKVTAKLAAESTLESMLATNFEDLWTSFNADGADDPGGVDSAPGATFAVTALSSQAVDPDGIVGRVEFPSAAGLIREDHVDAALNMPRDLNLDRIIDAEDHSADARILPVRIRSEWTGVSGDQFYEILYLFSDLAN